MTEEKDQKSKPCCHQNKDKKLIKMSDLPLYGNPYPRCEAIVDTDLGHIESGVKTVRTELTKYLSIFSGTSQRAQQILKTSFEHSKSTYEYISSEANTVPKAVAIASGGLIGLLLASRKGWFKKVMYMSVGLTAATAASYPKQANELSQLGFYIIKTKGPEIVKEYTGFDINETIGSKQKPKQEKTIDAIGQEVKTNLLPENEINRNQISSEIKGDFGMSKKDDKDLYANRSTK